MTSIRDFALFRDAKGRRCIAYNSDREHCLVVGDDGCQVFTLKAGDTNSVRIDAGQPKVRSMVAPNDRGPTGSGYLPAVVPVWFQGHVLIDGNFARMGPAKPSAYWWFLLAQIQRTPDPGDAPSSPPASLNIEIVNGMEYFCAYISHAGAPGGQKLAGPRVIVPRDKPFTFRFDYVDAKGGPDGSLRIVVTVEGHAPRTICDYRGVTGFDDKGGLYPAWGIYGIDGPGKWVSKQRPLVMHFDQLDWGTAQ